MSATEIIGPVVGGLLGLAGGAASANAQREMMQKNIDLQEEFAKNGIRWKVEDAKRAGIHPLAALGAGTTSFSPISVGDTSMGSAFSDFGQDISRAIQATSTSDEREQKFMDLKLEHGQLENDLLRSQIARINSAQVGPPMAAVSNSEMPRLTGRGYVEEKPLERIHSSPGRPEQEVGSVTDYGYARTSHGYALVPSQDVKNRVEDQLVPETMWSVRNNFLPNFSPDKYKPNPRDYPPPPGYNDWKWSPLLQQYVPWRSKWDSSRELIDSVESRTNRALEYWKRKRGK